MPTSFSRAGFTDQLLLLINQLFLFKKLSFVLHWQAAKLSPSAPRDVTKPSTLGGGGGCQKNWGEVKKIFQTNISINKSEKFFQTNISRFKLFQPR